MKKNSKWRVSRIHRNKLQQLSCYTLLIWVGPMVYLCNSSPLNTVWSFITKVNQRVVMKYAPWDVFNTQLTIWYKQKKCHHVTTTEDQSLHGYAQCGQTAKRLVRISPRLPVISPQASKKETGQEGWMSQEMTSVNTVCDTQTDHKQSYRRANVEMLTLSPRSATRDSRAAQGRWTH